jgi:hypothetical protein
MERGYARAEARNVEIRAGLEPLAPGERPPALVIGVVTCALLAIANLVLLAAGYDVRGEDTSAFGAVLFAGLLLAAAYGMWVRWAPAVLAFQALLALTIIVASLSVLVASNLAAVGLCLAIIVLGGWLFWKLVRVLSRIQAPRGSVDEPTR